MEQKIKTAKFLAKLLDNQFEVGGVRFGLDPILDFVPYLGDIAGAVLSFYILKTAHEVGVSKIDMLKMIGNVVIDFIVGFVPLLGVIFDVMYKANIRNIAILEKYSHGKFVEGTIVS
jgi:hypothetical protein